MATLAGFLERLFGEGRVVLDGPPSASASDADRDASAELLRRAFAEELMGLAGPPLDFDGPTALAAAEWTRRACWFLVCREDPPEVVDRALAAPPKPKAAAEHLAADLTFRYLPAVERRARAIEPGDVLSRRLAEVLRCWPLSGAASTVVEGPTTPVDFGGHEGLMLLYAERLAAREAPAWTPPEGRGLALLALACDAVGRRVPGAIGDGAGAGGAGVPAIGGGDGGRG